MLFLLFLIQAPLLAQEEGLEQNSLFASLVEWAYGQDQELVNGLQYYNRHPRSLGHPYLLEGWVHRLPLFFSIYFFVYLLLWTFIVAAALIAFGSLGLSWGQVQWLVAALGVGIGFGLQEIVANFISGIILLFERPIRIGDVITIGDTDGVVTRIRSRATTIRNWDGKELLVPNKEFITGRLLNWSLSDQTTRVILSVGIAYGSDVRLAMRLLEEAAGENENVLDDPDPSVIFETFGDNALAFRAYFWLRVTRPLDRHRVQSRLMLPEITEGHAVEPALILADEVLEGARLDKQERLSRCELAGPVSFTERGALAAVVAQHPAELRLLFFLFDVPLGAGSALARADVLEHRAGGAGDILVRVLDQLAEGRLDSARRTDARHRLDGGLPDLALLVLLRNPAFIAEEQLPAREVSTSTGQGAVNGKRGHLRSAWRSSGNSYS